MKASEIREMDADQIKKSLLSSKKNFSIFVSRMMLDSLRTQLRFQM